MPGELIFARIQENIFEEVFPEYFAKFLGEFARCEYMPRLYSQPCEYRKIFLANYLCIALLVSCQGVSQSTKVTLLTCSDCNSRSRADSLADGVSEIIFDTERPLTSPAAK